MEKVRVVAQFWEWESMTMMLQKYRFVEFDPDPVTGELAFTVLTNDIDQLLLEVYAVQKKCKPRGPTWVV